MEIREKTCKSGRKWRIVNESWSNSNAWGHKTTVIRSGYDFDPVKITYQNRTWECYKFQTCMFKAISTIYEDELNYFIKCYKCSNDIVRFKKGEKEKVIAMFEETEIAQDLKELRQAIDDRNFD